MKINFKRTSSKAIMPMQKDRLDAGIDFYSPTNNAIQPNESVLINLNIAWEPLNIPEGYKALLLMKSRSGMSCRFNIETSTGGVVDHGYRGEIIAKLTNMGEKVHVVNSGDKIIQGVALVSPIVDEINEVTEFTDEGKTERGDRGFGSSGK